ncbi:MAG: ATP-binding protein [Gammaproteobacteria bacterium]|nr:ATP-binding protein [Gammaproteobacteria bacterium]
MPSPPSLFPRLIEPTIRTALADTPVVCVTGPRQSGKTTLVRNMEANRAFYSLEQDTHYRFASSDPDGFIASLPDYVCLDEVQRVPALFHALKISVDQDRRPGRFLLTGSANPLLVPNASESLAGRMEVVQLQPLTEAEKERKPGHFLSDFLSGAFTPRLRPKSTLPKSTLEKRLVAGGYPEALARTPDRARQWHRQYLRSLIERDVKEAARVRGMNELERLMKLLALRTGQLLNVSNLASDTGLHRETIEHYIAVLERIFLVRRLPAWHSNASKRLLKSPKVHFLDSGLTATLVDLTVESWNDDRDRMGHLLESFALQQLTAQATWSDPSLNFWHYRDKDQVEVDIVLTQGRKVWGIEIKASVSLGSDVGRGLARLANKCKKDFVHGIVLYNGQDIFPVNDERILAVPLRELWKR